MLFLAVQMVSFPTTEDATLPTGLTMLKILASATLARFGDEDSPRLSLDVLGNVGYVSCSGIRFKDARLASKSTFSSVEEILWRLFIFAFEES